MRFSRQDRVFSDFQISKLLKSKKICIIGCGGVGSVLAELLVRGGSTHLILVDSDFVDETNLQRQIFVEKDLEQLKTKSLSKRLTNINSQIFIESFSELLTQKNCKKILFNADLIIDATDNFETREEINNFCETYNKDWIYCGAIKTQFVCCTFYGSEKLFRRVFPHKISNEESCSVGVLSSSTFGSASLCFSKIIKYFANIKEYELVKYDLWKNKIYKIKIK